MTKIKIISAALVLLGDKPISSLEDNLTESVVAAELYEATYTSLLSIHPWGFANKKARLSRKPEPIKGWAYTHALPSDMLRLKYADALDYKIYGSDLASNTKDVWVEYIERVDEQDLPPYFTSALIPELAAVFAIPITESTTKANYYEGKAAQALIVAKNVDSQQHPTTTFSDSVYLNL